MHPPQAVAPRRASPSRARSRARAPARRRRKWCAWVSLLGRGWIEHHPRTEAPMHFRRGRPYSAGMELDRRHLVHLSVVARHQSVTQAAQELGITQPALSRSIQEIERILGGRALLRPARAGRRSDLRVSRAPGARRIAARRLREARAGRPAARGFVRRIAHDRTRPGDLRRQRHPRSRVVDRAASEARDPQSSSSLRASYCAASRASSWTSSSETRA